MQHRPIAFIGAGNMTSAIINGMVKQGYPADAIMASNPSVEKLTALQSSCGIRVTQDNNAAVEWAEVIVLAVKPQVMEVACNTFNHQNLTHKTFISIAAGLPVARLFEMLGSPVALIRTMPNTPSAIGLGMTGLYAHPSVTESDKEFANNLMSMVGETVWLDSESDIDAVIAAAGSSPAYFFYMLEAMQAATESYGFSEADARRLVQQAMLGSAQLVINNPDTPLATLRAQVTSKGGATAEAIKVFEEQGFPATIKQAMDAAIERSQVLSKQL